MDPWSVTEGSVQSSSLTPPDDSWTLPGSRFEDQYGTPHRHSTDIFSTEPDSLHTYDFTPFSSEDLFQQPAKSTDWPLTSNMQPEKCPIVNSSYHLKGFARKSDQNRHSLTDYKDTMVCGFSPGSASAAQKSFVRKDVFKRHLASVHRVEQAPPNSRRKALASTVSRQSSQQDLHIRSKGGPSNERLLTIPITSNIQRTHHKLMCKLCSEHPDGFRGEHELRRHTDRAHNKIRKAWVIVDITAFAQKKSIECPKMPIANCKACRNNKHYGAYYNAAAHLRRAHFNPRKRGQGSKAKEDERRDCKPPMDELKRWMREVIEFVDFDCPPRASVHGVETAPPNSRRKTSASANREGLHTLSHLPLAGRHALDMDMEPAGMMSSSRAIVIRGVSDDIWQPQRSKVRKGIDGRYQRCGLRSSDDHAQSSDITSYSPSMNETIQCHGCTPIIAWTEPSNTNPTVLLIRALLIALCTLYWMFYHPSARTVSRTKGAREKMACLGGYAIFVVQGSTWPIDAGGFAV